MNAGVDGCRGGWLVALGTPLRFELCSCWSEVAELTAACTRVAVDMPIGLPAAGQRRACDGLARRCLGPRRHSIFSAPAREYLHASRFCEVQGMSLQSFHLLPKVRQLDDWMTPQRQARVWEAHPELVFARLAGTPLSHSKKTEAGRIQRLELLGRPALSQAYKRSQVNLDDLIDACALLWCAGRPGPVWGGPQRDERGLLMQIHG
ncbi:MAG: DUF429 domain-containing protein [Vulcanimicrobiota bacterium]